MDEPMDDDDHNMEPESNCNNSSVLRPGMMMSITIQDYEDIYWPKLKGAIDQLLTMSPGAYIPISYEQMYSCVYKCVCKQFSGKLYDDLKQHMTSYLEQLCQQLNNPAADVYIKNFHAALNQYLTALSGIVPIFNYMNRFYIELKLKTNLNKELLNLFVVHVGDKHIQSLIPLLVQASSKPFYVSPPVMASVIKNLHTLKPDYSSLCPMLFAKYLPNILPPCSVLDLERHQAEAQQIQRDLLTHPEFIRGDQGRKRPGDDICQQSPQVSVLPKNS